jgi:hypothetical protein
VPNSGPPMERLGLLPPKDTTAYIIERILLPPESLAADGRPRPKRMMYIIGWTDLPAACLLVPAMRVLDYVSPRVLEDWEMDMEEELEEERARQEAEKQQQQQAQPKAGPKKRSKGRRPRKRSQIESAMLNELETDGSAERLTGGAMAQTTPKKARRKHAVDLPEEEDSPSRQLEKELIGATPDPGDMEMFETEATSEDVEFKDSDSALEPRPARMMLEVLKQPPAQALRRGDLARANEPQHIVISDSSESDSGGNISLIGRETETYEPVYPAKRRRIHSSSDDSLMPFRPPDSGTHISRNMKSPRTIPEKEAKTKVTEDTHQKRSKSVSEPPAQSSADGQEEPTWVVECILDCQTYEVEGHGLVRYFQVLWEGDWPPDQNPSWEPEENLPRALVRNFFKTPKERRRRFKAKPQAQGQGGSLIKTPVPKRLAASQTKLKQSTLSWAGARYDSVSEAFAGDGGDDILASMNNATNGQDSGPLARELDNDIGGEDELFVVEDGPTDKNHTNNHGAWFSSSNGASSHGVQRYLGFA